MTSPNKIFGLWICPACGARFHWHTHALEDPSRGTWFPRMGPAFHDCPVGYPATGTTGRMVSWTVYR